MNHLFDLVRSRMPEAGKPCLEREDGRVLTYGDLLAETGRLANALVGLGVKPGDRVAAQVEKSPEALLLYLACVRAGAVFLPLNPGYMLREVEYFLLDAEPAVVVCPPGKNAEMEGIAAKDCRVVTLGHKGDGSVVELAAGQPENFEDRPREAGDLAAILYTSGTTGRSKGAMLTHGNLASNALTLVDYWRFTRDDVLIHALPIFHTHGLFVAFNTVLLSGAKMLFFQRFDPAEVITAFPRSTAMMGVPTFYVRLLDHPGLAGARLETMRLFVSGSAPLLAETFSAWKERTGHAILERYGMTETNMNTSNPYDGERMAGTVGFPLPGVDLRVVDPATGEKLGGEAIGMIEVRGPNVFSGYWRMPEKTAEEFHPDGFFITGDLGKIDAQGYVQIVGRGKDLIISGGLNVYPKEVETEIDLLPGVLESAVIGLAHPDFGEGVTAVVVRERGAEIDEAAVLRGLENRLAKFKQPKRVMFVEELPRNTMGKVQKNVLRQTYEGLYRKG
ncbi:malonate--CoA ligase [Mesorhizobium sp. ASY16-5R]|uniref:malonate--CoA ligase n=1 Tax=Mesorhizobium sp. ASY16-5R TaxID=3445772 RepID=UPI003F9F9B17